jgi:type IV secretory pathway TrbL component
MITISMRELKRLIGSSGRQRARAGGAARISRSGSAAGQSPHAIPTIKEPEEAWAELDRLCAEIEASLKDNQAALRAPLLERR